MSAKATTGNSRSIKVDYLTRVEGEAAIAVKLKGDQVQDVQFQIFEPPRLFEAFLRGRHYLEDTGPGGAHLRHLSRSPTR
jgi:sulfhydrogenase subunit alpha